MSSDVLGRSRACRLVVIGVGAFLLGGTVALGQVKISAANGGAVSAISAEGTKPKALSGPIRGPVLGYLFERDSRSLRPLLGLPGASHVGAALILGLQPEFVEVSPSQEFALAVEAVTGAVRLIDLRTGLPAGSAIPGVDPGVDRIVFSPGGAAAALYRRQAGQVQIVTGLPAEPAVAGRVDLASLPGVLTALAVSDDGEALLAAVSQEDRASLYVAGPGEDARLLAPAGRVSAMAFLHDSRDALVADYNTNEILRIRDVTGGGTLTVLASERDGIQHPVAVAASTDNRQAFAASSAARSVASVPLAGGATVVTACNCTPTSLLPLRGNSVFQMTEAAGSPIYLLDAGSTATSQDPRILFVPASQPSDPTDAVPSGPASRGRLGR